MPTVRADIEPVAVFPAVKGKNAQPRVSVFPAHHWEQWGGEPGMFRLMVGQKWLAREGETISFWDVQGVGAVLGQRAMAALGHTPQDCARDGVLPVTLSPGSFVWYLDPETGRNIAARTNSYPFQGVEGGWRVYLLYPRNLPAVPLDYLTPRERGAQSWEAS